VTNRSARRARHRRHKARTAQRWWSPWQPPRTGHNPRCLRDRRRRAFGRLCKALGWRATKPGDITMLPSAAGGHVIRWNVEPKLRIAHPAMVAGTVQPLEFVEHAKP
jgi:hypothetical protein